MMWQNANVVVGVVCLVTQFYGISIMDSSFVLFGQVGVIVCVFSQFFASSMMGEYIFSDRELENLKNKKDK